MRFLVEKYKVLLDFQCLLANIIVYLVCIVFIIHEYAYIILGVCRGITDKRVIPTLKWSPF